ncbi:hypothetical protein [Tunturiibacter empetritectus]|uniref:hypothetical protein n=1 Tax=Tunturiibacter empetritectus TaxID=3069691 RepID=UPI003D9B57D1
MDPQGITSEIVAQYLTSLGCNLLLHGLRDDQAVYSTRLPSWRLDLEREIDLIEEVARVYGYNRFANTLPAPGVVLTQPTAAKEAAVRTRLLALGFSESISSTFASQQDSDLFYAAARAQNPGAPHLDSEMWASSEPGSPTSAFARGGGEGRPLPSTPRAIVPLENPLSEEASLLRPSLIPGMVTMLAHNLNRDVREVRLFEQGQVFTATIPADASYISNVHESPQLSLGLTTATPQPTAPLQVAADAPFFELKGAIESLLSLFDLNAARDTFPPRVLASEKESSSQPEAASNVFAPQGQMSEKELSSRTEAALLPPERRDPRISSVQPLTFSATAPTGSSPAAAQPLS